MPSPPVRAIARLVALGFVASALLLSVAACAPAQRAAPEASVPSGAAAKRVEGLSTPSPQEPETSVTALPRAPQASETATFAAGCYWCVEAVFEQIEGVTAVSSGFMGGAVERPTYYQVCDGDTGHAEVVQITFDPAKVSFERLVEVFWDAHDPTTLNRQGADAGTQYRSAIFYHSEAQQKTALASKQKAQAKFEDPITTEITAASTYYEGPSDHQDYYRNNRDGGYCRAVIRPKLKKLGLKE